MSGICGDEADRRTVRIRAACRAGLTLLEVMLAMAVSALLLAALLSALGLYLRAFDSGRSGVEQAQLARGLLARVSADLRALRPISPPERRAAGNSSREGGRTSGSVAATAGAGGARADGEPEFVLRGGARELELEVIAETEVRESAENESTETSHASAPRGVNWRRVRYAWLSGEEASERMSGPVRGGRWVREVLAEIPRRKGRGVVNHSAPEGPQGRASDRLDVAEGSPPADFSIGADAVEREAMPFGDGDTEDGTTAATADEAAARSELAEVAGWELRYFDGRAWRHTWDSIRQRGLPQAVEIQVALWRGAAAVSPRSDRAGAVGEHLPAEPEFFSPTGDGRQGTTEASAEDPRWVIYRQVVALPQAVGGERSGGQGAEPARATGERGIETIPGVE